MTEVNAQKQMEYELNRLGRLVEEQKTLMRRQDERHLAEMQRAQELAKAIVSLESSPMQKDYVAPQIQALARAFLEGK